MTLNVEAPAPVAAGSGRETGRLGSLTAFEYKPLSTFDQAATRLAARFGLTEPVARVVALHAGLGCEVTA